MEACGNLRWPAARRKLGVPGPSVCEVEPLKKDPSELRLCYAMEIEVVLMCSIVLFFFFLFSFSLFLFFLFAFVFSFLFCFCFSRLLKKKEITDSRNTN